MPVWVVYIPLVSETIKQKLFADGPSGKRTELQLRQLLFKSL